MAKERNCPILGGKEESCCAGQGGEAAEAAWRNRLCHQQRLPSHPSAWDVILVIQDDMFWRWEMEKQCKREREKAQPLSQRDCVSAERTERAPLAEAGGGKLEEVVFQKGHHREQESVS